MVNPKVFYMKNKKSIYLAALAIIATLASCQKEKVADVENFNVYTSGSLTTFRVGTNVSFVLSGNPDNISFYSGEKGHDYEFRNRVSRNDGDLRLSFQTRAQNTACFTALAAGALKVYFSNSFPAHFSTLTDALLANSQDSAMLNNNGYWTDITGRFFIPASGTASVYYPSGDTSLNDLITNPDYPCTVAFKMSTPSHGSLSTNGITIGSMNFYSKFPDTTVKHNLEPGGSTGKIWKVINAANAADSFYKTTTSLKYLGGAATTYSEDWAVSTSYNVTVYPSDIGLAIKNISNNPLTTYSHRFTEPGTHKVVFVASNNRVNGRTEIIKEIIVNIVP